VLTEAGIPLTVPSGVEGEPYWYWLTPVNRVAKLVGERDALRGLLRESYGRLLGEAIIDADFLYRVRAEVSDGK
jgi:hypothetical protein